jgi:formylglycine-generating enzyme required for sulfatase activity
MDKQKKHFKFFFLLLMIALISSNCVNTGGVIDGLTLLDAIEQSADNIVSEFPPGSRVAVVAFSSESENLSDFIMEELSGALFDRGVEVTDRQNLEHVYKELNFQMSGDVSDESAQSIGKFLGAQLVVTGQLRNLGNTYRFTVNTIHVEKATRASMRRFNIRNDTEMKEMISLLNQQNITARTASYNAADQTASQSQPQSQIQSASANMVLIPAGSFTIGSPSTEPQRSTDEAPQHRVTISSFHMGKYPVTVGEFRRFVNSAEYTTEAETGSGSRVWTDGRWMTLRDASWKKPYISQNDNHPVVLVTWIDVLHYCNWLSEQERLRPVYTITRSGTVIWNHGANGYRLPTEAEWEYACRAGTTTPFYTGNNITTSQANYDGNEPYNNNAPGEFRQATTPVGSFQPNAWGLYDMHGNVWEWCWDRYMPYKNEAQTDPIDTSSGSLYSRVFRGGSWLSEGELLRSAYRGGNVSSSSAVNVGFRLARGAR